MEKYSANDSKENKILPKEDLFESEQFKKLPKDAQKKLKNIKIKLDQFSKEIVEKFDKYVVGVALLPPEQQLKAQLGPEIQPLGQDVPPKEQEKKPEENKDQINVLVLVDDTDSKKMTKEELKTKLVTIIEDIAKKVDKNLTPETILLSELWQSCYDAKYDLLQMIALAAPVYDKGMLQAIKIAEVHKTMVLKKFEKYIVSYVLGGSLIQGKATKDSDIDVWIVVDDTDVKKMTRIELREKLRAIIIGMGMEAGSITGITNKLNIQVWILTEYWDCLKEANPVMFTLLRDGVPFYDRGIFMPWKQLLAMGKIKPSPEAIDLFMSSGDQMLDRAHKRITEIGMEDIFWAILTPSQAALMLYGIPPPTPKETPGLMRELFVKKEKILDDKQVKVLETVIKMRKDVEYGIKKEISGNEIDKILKDSENYLKQIKKLFEKIERIKENEDMANVYETIITIARDLLKSEGVTEVDNKDLVEKFRTNVINTGKLSEKSIRIMKEIFKAKKDFDEKKLTKPEVEKAKKDSRDLIKMMIEFMQKRRVREVERAKFRIKYGENIGEVIILGDSVFIIKELKKEQREILKAKLTPGGGLGKTVKSSDDEIEASVAGFEKIPEVHLSKEIIKDLEKIFGKEVSVLVY